MHKINKSIKCFYYCTILWKKPFVERQLIVAAVSDRGSRERRGRVRAEPYRHGRRRWTTCRWWRCPCRPPPALPPPSPGSTPPTAPRSPPAARGRDGVGRGGGGGMGKGRSWEGRRGKGRSGERRRGRNGERAELGGEEGIFTNRNNCLVWILNFRSKSSKVLINA